MKFDLMLRAYGMVWGSMIKKGVEDKKARKAISKEYREIMERASDIGSKNNLLSSYSLAAFFIAMNRKSGLDAEGNYKALENGIRTSKAAKAFMGSADGYFNEKRMAMRREWSKQTHEKRYKNDWVVDILEKCDDYEMGYDYTECGVCKLCRDEGCFELAKYLCKLDFLLVSIMGIELKRTTTLAEGGDKCDFRFIR